ncbi:MAG: sulfatase-like hydrolase/transferase, partial [Planctomycetota bacterium]
MALRTYVRFPCMLSLGLLFALSFNLIAKELSSESTANATSERPNFVIIFCDDLGWSDLGCYGSEIETPNIDRLASQGLRFTQAYNTCRCCPSRASLLTGLWSHQAGIGMMVYRDSGPGYEGNLSERVVTFGDALGAAGYQTMMVGKWHVG